MELLILEEIGSILNSMSLEKYPLNKPFLLVRIGIIVLFVLFFIFKNYLPEGEGGWSKPPIFDYVFLLGIGICLSITTITYTYYAWTQTAKEHIEWLESQKVAMAQKKRSEFSESYGLWSMQLISPIGALIGILLTGFMLFSIFKYFFG